MPLKVKKPCAIDHTDESHPATICQIVTYLNGFGVSAGPKLAGDDIEQLRIRYYL